MDGRNDASCNYKRVCDLLKVIPLFKQLLPDDEADQDLNIALNLLARGNCLEHIEDRRCDEAYLTVVGAQRISDPHDRR